jgi:hypothetical protein
LTYSLRRENEIDFTEQTRQRDCDADRIQRPGLDASLRANLNAGTKHQKYDDARIEPFRLQFIDNRWQTTNCSPRRGEWYLRFAETALSRLHGATHIKGIRKALLAAKWPNGKVFSPQKPNRPAAANVRKSR